MIALLVRFLSMRTLHGKESNPYVLINRRYLTTGMWLEGKLIICVTSLRSMVTRDVNHNGTWRAFFEGDVFSKAYIEFLFELTVCMVNTRKVKRALLKGKSILEIVTPSDEAQAAFNYINNHSKWKLRHDERDNPAHPIHTDRSGGIFANPRGRGRFKSGLTAEGTALLKKINNFFLQARQQEEYLEDYKKRCSEWYDGSSVKIKVDASKKKKKARAGQINGSAREMEPLPPLPLHVMAAVNKEESDSDEECEEDDLGGVGDFNEHDYLEDEDGVAGAEGENVVTGL